jgi:hypothetical protein
MKIPTSLPVIGHNIPVFAAFSGPRLARRGLRSHWTLAYNNIFASLVLYPKHFEYRVILKSSKQYSEIQEIWTRPHRLSKILGDCHQLCIAFKNSCWGVTLVSEKSIIQQAILTLESLGVIVVPYEE